MFYFIAVTGIITQWAIFWSEFNVVSMEKVVPISLIRTRSLSVTNVLKEYIITRVVVFR